MSCFLMITTIIIFIMFMSFIEHLLLPETVLNPFCGLSYFTSHWPYQGGNFVLPISWMRKRSLRLVKECAWGHVICLLLAIIQDSLQISQPQGLQTPTERFSVYILRSYTLSPQYIYSSNLINWLPSLAPLPLSSSKYLVNFH